MTADFAAEDVTVTGGTLSAFLDGAGGTAVGQAFSFSVTPDADGTVCDAMRVRAWGQCFNCTCMYIIDTASFFVYKETHCEKRERLRFSVARRASRCFTRREL